MCVNAGGARYGRALNWFGLVNSSIDVLQQCATQSRAVSSLLGFECWESLAWAYLGAGRGGEAREAILTAKAMVAEQMACRSRFASE